MPTKVTRRRANMCCVWGLAIDSTGVELPAMRTTRRSLCRVRLPPTPPRQVHCRHPTAVLASIHTYPSRTRLCLDYKGSTSRPDVKVDRSVGSGPLLKSTGRWGVAHRQRQRSEDVESKSVRANWVFGATNVLGQKKAVRKEQ